MNRKMSEVRDKSLRATESGLRFKAKIDLKRDKIDKDARTIEIALSSEYPVNRGWYTEILSHNSDDVDLSRMNDSHPFLVNHNTDDQVGVVERTWLDADKKLRSLVRFGNSTRANEIFKDICDGIRKHISVGYEHTKEISTERNGDMETVRFAWRPYEASTVPIPADPTVGVGRNKRNEVVSQNADGEGETEFTECENCGHKAIHSDGKVPEKCPVCDADMTASDKHSAEKLEKICNVVNEVRSLLHNLRQRRLKRSGHECHCKDCLKARKADNAYIAALEEKLGYDIDGDNEEGESAEHKDKVPHTANEENEEESGDHNKEESEHAHKGGKVRGKEATCPECGESFPEDEFPEVDGDELECPSCKATFEADELKEENEEADESNSADGEHSFQYSCNFCGLRNDSEKMLRGKDGEVSCPGCNSTDLVKSEKVQSEEDVRYSACPGCGTAISHGEVLDGEDGQKKCPHCGSYLKKVTD